MEQYNERDLELLRDIENGMKECQQMRDLIIVTKQKVIQWRKYIELGLRNDIEDVERCEAMIKQAQSENESNATEWQDIQNQVASRYPSA